MERNEALDIVRKTYPHVSESGTQFETALRTLIPELKESEDERIRKEIIEGLKQMKEKGSFVFVPSHIDSAIAWLEKQGSQNLANSAKTCKDLQESAIEEFESEWKRYCDTKGGGAVTMNVKDLARHFAQWGVEHVKKSDISQPIAETCKENEDSLTDEELEKAANDFSESDPPLYGNRYYWDSESLFGEQLKTTFKAGAQWQKEQMMKDAVEGEVETLYRHIIYVKSVGFDSGSIRENKQGVFAGDKVKVIIIKE